MRTRKGHARRRARKRLFREVKGNFGARGKLVKMASSDDPGTFRLGTCGREGRPYTPGSSTSK